MKVFDSGKSIGYFFFVFVFFASFNTLLNRITYGFGYFLITLIFIFGLAFNSFKFKILKIQLLIFFIFAIVGFCNLILFQFFSAEVFLRILLVLVAYLIGFGFQNSNFFDTFKIASFFLFFSLLSAIYGIKQFFIGYNFIDLLLLSFNNSMEDELLVGSIKRGLGFFYDPLSQSSLLGIGFHSYFFLKDKKFYNKYLLYIVAFIILVGLFITLSRAGIIGMVVSMIVYFSRRQLFRVLFIVIFLFVFTSIILPILNTITFESPDVQNVFDSMTSIFQVFNSDLAVSGRFDVAGSYGSRMDGINNIFINFFSSEKLYNTSKLHSSRDLGFLAVAVEYGQINFLLFIALVVYVILKSFNKLLFNFNYSNRFFVSICIFIISQSFVTFQLDSFYNSFLLFFFFSFYKLSDKVTQVDLVE